MHFHHWLWLITLLSRRRFCIVASMSSSTVTQHPRSTGKDFVEREQYLTRDSYSDPVRRLNAAHLPVNNSTTLQSWKGEGRGMLAAGKKEDVQGDRRAVQAEDMPILSHDSSPSPLSAVPVTTALALTSTPSSAPASVVVAPLNTSPSGQSSYQGQSRTGPLAAPQSAVASVTPSAPSSASGFPPALLVFVILFVCFLLLVVILAIRRIRGRQSSRVPVASPLFHGDPTATGAEHNWREAFPMSESKMQARDAVLRSDHVRPRVIQSDRKSNPFRDGGSISEASTFSSTHVDIPRPSPVRVIGSTPQAPRSRVPRPYVPRPYHRPHPAYTADPESVQPLMAREGSANGDLVIGINRKEGRIGVNAKGKGKENERQGKVTSHARRRRDTLSATSNRSTRPFVSPNAEPPAPSKLGVDLEPLTCSSAPTTKMHDDQQDVDSLLSSGSTTVEIGLAMLKEFSSPHVGLGFDLHRKSSDSCPPSQGEDTGRSSNSDASRMTVDAMDVPTERTSEGIPPYLTESTSSGSKGLAYLASELTPSDQIEESDITENSLDLAAALATYRARNVKAGFEPPGDSANPDLETRQVELGDQESLDDHTFSEPVHSDFKAPTLPTLSEMALSRADPLYESVTNELFASYGVRMSTGSGVGRMSRVSARISKMLSWFGDAGAKEGRPSGMPDTMTGVEELMSIEDGLTDTEGYRTSGVVVGGVQPLRIGKLRRSPE